MITISDDLYIQFTMFKHGCEDGKHYTAWVEGVNGKVSNWDAFEELRIMIIEDDYTSHPQVRPILKRYDHERDGAITMLAKLSLIDAETQIGSGEGNVNVIPEYYDIIECHDIKFERLTLDA